MNVSTVAGCGSQQSWCKAAIQQVKKICTSHLCGEFSNEQSDKHIFLEIIYESAVAPNMVHLSFI